MLFLSRCDNVNLYLLPYNDKAEHSKHTHTHLKKALLPSTFLLKIPHEHALYTVCQYSDFQEKAQKVSIRNKLLRTAVIQNRLDYCRPCTNLGMEEIQNVFSNTIKR